MVFLKKNDWLCSFFIKIQKISKNEQKLRDQEDMG